MTPAELSALQDRELIAIQLPGDPGGPDVFLAGRCVRPDNERIACYITHPEAPVMVCLTLQDEPGQFKFHSSGTTLNEAMRDKKFASSFYLAKSILSLNDAGGHSAYVYTSIALSLNQLSNANPDLTTKFVERVAARHYEFCAQYSVNRVLN